MRAPHPLLPLRRPDYPLATVAMSYPLPGGPEPLTPRPSPLLLSPLFCLFTLFATGLDKGPRAAVPRPCARPPLPFIPSHWRHIATRVGRRSLPLPLRAGPVARPPKKTAKNGASDHPRPHEDRPPIFPPSPLSFHAPLTAVLSFFRTLFAPILFGMSRKLRLHRITLAGNSLADWGWETSCEKT